MASDGDISQDTVIVLAVVLPVVFAIAVILYLICSGCCESKPLEDNGLSNVNDGEQYANGENNRGLTNVAAPTEKTALLSASKPKSAATSSSSISSSNTTTEIAKEGKNDVEQPFDSKSWSSLSSIDFLNPMDLLGIGGGSPVVWPTLSDGPEQALLTKNNPVLFEIYLFYAFHADNVRDARANGKAKATFVGNEAYRAAVMSPNPCDQPFLSHSNLQDLLKDFKLISGSATTPWLSKELTKEEEDLITYRRFIALLMKVGEDLKPEAPRDKSFLNVIETMDCSEQLYIMQDTGHMHSSTVQFVTDMSK